MPRSPAEGAATRGPDVLDRAAHQPLPRDRRVRSGTDRRNHNVGPPNGVERRAYERRSHDRRSHQRTDRRAGDRRSSPKGRRGSASRTTPLGQTPRPLPRKYTMPAAERSSSARILRAVIITVVALACLLAATLTQVPDAGAATKGKTGSVRVKVGDVAATVTYRLAKQGSIKVFGGLRLTVSGGGRTTLRKSRLPGASAGYLVKPEITLADVTADGTLDVVVATNSGGAHCCQISSVARSTPTGWSTPTTRNWRDYGYKLVDLGGTPTPEFEAFDDRFIELYTSYAGSRAPIRIWSMAGGKLADVTKAFPDLVRADVAEHAQAWTDADKFDDGKGRKILGRTALASWVADLSLLGAYDEAKAAVAGARDRGDFSDFAEFPGVLGHDLKTFGYVGDPTVVGLTDEPMTAPAGG